MVEPSSISKHSVLNNVVSQCINNQGKCIVLNYEHPQSSLAISPLPPLYVPEVKDTEIFRMNINDIKNFLESKNLIIVEQTLSINNTNTESDEIQGVWVKSKSNPPEIIYGYIPLQPKTPKLKDVELSNETIVPPIIEEEIITKNNEELFKNYSYNEKIACFLKECSLKTFVTNNKRLTEDDFIEISNYVYDLKDIGSGKILGNPVFYDWAQGKYNIIVLDKETIRRLINYVKISYLNDVNIYDLYLSKTYFNFGVIYSNISDFTPKQDQYIFNGIESILRWKSVYRKDGYTISFKPLPKVQNPYYYINNRIVKGKLLLVQNTSSGNFVVALAIAYKMDPSNDGFSSNPGYYPPDDLYIPTTPSFNIYTEAGLIHRSDKRPSNEIGGTPRLKLFGYKDGTYAAMYVINQK